MGMAASQARFLGLTARKTNVEYQGQQVNQARTALANESAGLFNSMMVLAVPVPPVVNDYYETRYNFDSATNTNYSISSIKESTDPDYPDGYDVVINYTKKVLTGYKLSQDAEITKVDDGAGGYYYAYSDGTELKATTAADTNNINAIMNNPYFNYPVGQEFLKYINPDDNNIVYYVAAPDASLPATYDSMVHYTADKSTTAQAKGVAMFDTEDGSNRYTSATFHKIVPAEAGKDIGENVPHELDISKTYNEEAYSEAMKNYEYDKMVYENEIQRINAKTEKLQMQDRTLELKLRQLDTEQKALQTEMESVQKVIQKNVEVTFKTFA